MSSANNTEHFCYCNMNERLKHGPQKGDLDLKISAKKVVFLVSRGKKQISPPVAILQLQKWRGGNAWPMEKVGRLT